jgi:conserved oligomeric Golgi complex subunit 2
VPRSPLIPHTPLPPRSRSPMFTQSGSYYPPRTPYTPFTAFASKENPFALASTSAHLLDETEDALAGLYNQILKFVDRDLKKIMQIAETVCVKSGSRRKTEMESLRPLRRERGDGFEIMANVVWAEVGRAIMDELGHVVFSAGKTDEFRKVPLSINHMHFPTFIHF